MKTIRTLSLSAIDCDRLPLNKKTLALVNYLECGGHVPPIHVQPTKDGRFNILDGRHRFLAFKLLEKGSIEVKYGIDTREIHGEDGLQPNTQGNLLGCRD